MPPRPPGADVRAEPPRTSPGWVEFVCRVTFCPLRALAFMAQRRFKDLAQGYAANPLQQVFKSRIPGNVRAQGHGVEK